MNVDAHDIAITLATAAFFGVFFIILSYKLKTSAISLLLLGGILLGPHFLGLVRPDSLGSETLRVVVSLAVGLILFEGGLTLDIKGYREVSKEILGVLTKGVLITWIATAVALRLIFGFEWTFCALAASLVIVTGPTVIGPLLQRVRVKKSLHHLLHWESVLIDPIGVFLALLCYEWIVSADVADAPMNFLLRVASGAAVGAAAGMGVHWTLRRRFIPEEHLNIFVVVSALLTLGAADAIVAESGLLSVTIAGLWIGSRETPGLRQIVAYKTELKDLLIGLLFILLAAHLELGDFANYGWKLGLVLALVMFLIRPLNIFLSAWRSELKTRDKLFLSWIAPRGIVAASMASLFALNLGEQGLANAEFLEPFTYLVIAGTVLVQAFTAKPVAKALGVLEGRPEGWLIVGANRLSRAVAKFVVDHGQPVVLLDTNARRIRIAREQGLTAIYGNALEYSPDNDTSLYEIGHVLAATSNEDLNRLICMRWKLLIDQPSLFYWSQREPGSDETDRELAPGDSVWGQLPQEALEGKTGAMKVEERAAEDIAPGEMVLMSFWNGKLYPGMPAGVEDKATCLVLLKLF